MLLGYSALRRRTRRGGNSPEACTEANAAAGGSLVVALAPGPAAQGRAIVPRAVATTHRASVHGPSRRAVARTGIKCLAVVGAVSLAAATGYVATIEGSSVKIAMLVLATLGLPIVLVHLELGGLAFLGVLWARVSDVAIKFHGFPSLALPFGALLIGVSLIRKLVQGERITSSTFKDIYPSLPYVLVVLLSGLWAAFPGVAFASAATLVKDVFIFWVLADTLRGPWSVKGASYVLVLTAGLLSAANLHQYFADNFSSNYGGFAQAEVRNILGEFDSYRLGGPLDTPNVFPAILALTVPLALGLLRTRLHPIGRCVVAGTLPLIVLTILLTYSRGAAVLLAALLLISMPRHRIGAGQAAIAGVMVVLVVLYAPATVWGRLETLALPLTGRGEVGRVLDFAVDLRLGAHRTAIEMFLSSPLVGIGAGNYPLLYEEYSRWLGIQSAAQLAQPIYWPHNAYLEVLSETGILGLIAYGGLVLAYMSRLRRARSRIQSDDRDSHDQREMSYGIEAALLGFLIHGFFEGLAYPRYLWMLLALVVVAARSASPRTGREASSLSAAEIRGLAEAPSERA